MHLLARLSCRCRRRRRGSLCCRSPLGNQCTRHQQCRLLCLIRSCSSRSPSGQSDGHTPSCAERPTLSILLRAPDQISLVSDHAKPDAENYHSERTAAVLSISQSQDMPQIDTLATAWHTTPSIFPHGPMAPPAVISHPPRSNPCSHRIPIRTLPYPPFAHCASSPRNNNPSLYLTPHRPSPHPLKVTAWWVAGHSSPSSHTLHIQPTLP